jgi:DNA-3-methyladenine glycosylase II
MDPDCTWGTADPAPHTQPVRTITIKPEGPFDLATARDFAGGFAAGIGSRAVSDGAILMAFPVEGWATSAVVQLRQADDGRLQGDVYGDADLASVVRQAARSLSVDHDGTGWPEVGRRDPVVGRLQERFGCLRPVCFFSAYEAATSFVIGQRISMAQTRRVKDRLAAEAGDAVEVEIDGESRTVRAFPRPQQLLALAEIPGVAAVKVERLHGLARAALDGRLDTEQLRDLPEEEALAQLRDLPGIGEWTATGVLTRGCGVADALPLGDRISREAVRHFHDLPELPDDAAWSAIAEPWRPYRMWATVLLHMAWRREQPAVPSDRRRPRPEPGRPGV